MTTRAKTTAASTAGSFAPDVKAEPAVVLGTDPVCRADRFGTRRWVLDDEIHRTDGPAVEWADGTKEWYLNGKRHRTDGPAIEWADGTRQWWVNGKRHRTDGPAIERSDGTKEWYLNGVSYPNERKWRAAMEAPAHM